MVDVEQVIQQYRPRHIMGRCLKPIDKWICPPDCPVEAHGLLETDEAEPPPCHFGHGAIVDGIYRQELAVARYKFPEGCICFPNDREMNLCPQHVIRASPLGGMTMIEAYDPRWPW